jgi:hypothetical protein
MKNIKIFINDLEFEAVTIIGKIKGNLEELKRLKNNGQNN